MRFILMMIVVFSISTVSVAEELETAACVQNPDSFTGVIVSKIISDPHYEGRKWCYVYTDNNTVNAWVDELEAISCEEALANFPRKRKKMLFQWLDGGSNPMFSDIVDRSD